MKSRRVVITGAAMASPLGYSLAENVAGFREGRSNFSRMEEYDLSRSLVHFAGQCPKPDIAKLPDKKVQKILRRKDVVGLLVALDAVEHAGLRNALKNPDRFGMYVGAGSTRLSDLTAYYELLEKCVDLEKNSFDGKLFGRELMGSVNPLVVLQTLMNNGLCFATMTLDIRGVNANFMDYQLAGFRAVIEAARAIEADRADIVLAGGIAGPVEPFQLSDGVRGGYLADTSKENCHPETLIKPYDKARMGTILSEGSAFLVLEDEGHAMARRANILGRIQGSGLANDGVFEFLKEKECPGLSRAMRLALAEAQCSARDIGFVVGYGNGAMASDMVEAEAYASLFLDAGTPITTPKSVLGDMSEASGVVGIIEALNTLEHDTVPKIYNMDDPLHSGIALAREFLPYQKKSALVTCRNFMGMAGALVVGG